MMQYQEIIDLLPDDYLAVYFDGNINYFANYLSQCSVESSGFTVLNESFNYSSDALLKVFPNEFDSNTAIQYGRTVNHSADQKAIANICYSNRLGNGDVSSGDGWNYSGKGYLQITGLNNYTQLYNDTGLDVVNNPDLLLIPANAMLSALWFWKSRDCNAVADSIKETTRKINGNALENLDQRENLYWVYLGIIQQHTNI